MSTFLGGFPSKNPDLSDLNVLSDYWTVVRSTSFFIVKVQEFVFQQRSDFLENGTIICFKTSIIILEAH